MISKLKYVFAEKLPLWGQGQGTKFWLWLELWHIKYKK